MTPRERERAQAIAAELQRRARGLALPDTHIGQATVLASPARFRVLRCGRRWRKSSTAMQALVHGTKALPGAELKPGGRYWWVWPTGPMGQTGWDMLREVCAGRWDVSESRRRVTAPNGAEIWVKSSDHEDGLRGAGLDGVAFAECREMRGRVWHEVIRPALADRKGWALFESTPRGMDWFYDLDEYAGRHEGWAHWHFSSYDNPTLDPLELDAAKTTMTERMFEQEIMALYLTDGAYFQNVDACCTVTEPDEPHEHKGHTIVMGVDWGQSNDWTVLTLICRECARVVDWARFNQIDFIYQRARLVEYAKRWNVRHILPERNSIGVPNIEMLLAADHLPIENGPDDKPGFYTTAASKAMLIEGLALAFSKTELAAPVDYAGEMRAFEIETRPTAPPKFSAPDNQHDDMVISLALAWYMAANGVELAGEVTYAQSFTIGGLSPY